MFMYVHSGYDPRTNEIIYTTFARVDEAPDPIPEGTNLVLSTDDALDSPNLFGDTLFDFYIKNNSTGNSIVTRPGVLAYLNELNLKRISYPSGAVIQWIHYSPTTENGYNFHAQDAIDQGIDPCDVQAGIGCHTYGIDFFEEYIYTIDNMPLVQEIFFVHEGLQCLQSFECRNFYC